MNKRVAIGVISAGVLLLSAIGISSNDQSSKLDSVHTSSTAPATENIPKKVIPTCDGTTVTTSCTLESISYKTYIYHPAVPEKTHTETVTTYQEEITGYCTLCSDGTYSPSCATGSGACSHHGGVAQWNAPISRNVPVNSTKTVVDAPAQEAYYEKVVENSHP
jgi:hypothetical protein